MSKKKMQRTVVIGGGVMGADIATVFSAGGWKVEIVEPSASTRTTLPKKLAENIKRLKLKNHLQPAAIHQTLEDVSWKGVDIVVECITEDLGLKHALFAKLEGLVSPGVPLTSNSSSFPISKIGSGLKTQSRMMGLHFFMPAHITPLVEVICSKRTDAMLAETVATWMRTLGKRPVHVKRDVIGFLGNRLQAALTREALFLIGADVASPEDVDAAVRYGFGFRYAAAGPITQKEHSGWDVTDTVANIIYPELCNARSSISVLRKMVAKGHLGIKSGRGFYKWDATSIKNEKKRYEKALMATLEILRSEKPAKKS